MARPSLIHAATARVSDYMVKLGARAPQTRYLGRQINLGLSGDAESGVVRTLCSFLTASGLERELEVPVVVHQGELLDPVVAMVGGNPVVLTAELLEGISQAGTVMEKPRLGSIYSLVYSDPNAYREMSEAIAPVPILYRPLY